MNKQSPRKNVVMLLPSILLSIVLLISNEDVVVKGAYAPLMEDNASIRLDVVGRSDVRATSWADSYSDGGSCYCASTFDHDIGIVVVDTPLGPMTVKEICDLMGVGPRGREGRPMYNDIQCGNGPAYVNGDEIECPGRTEYGKEGCKYIGPKWNFSPHMPSATPPAAPPVRAPIKAPVKPPTRAPVKAPTRAPVKPPTRSPIKSPTGVPVISPIRTPVKLPTRAPVQPPALAQVPTSTTAVRRRYAPLMEDNVSIRLDVVGRSDVRPLSWADSYSDGGSCYCASTYDGEVANMIVDTPLGRMTVKEVCTLLGEGPRGRDGRPRYNDIQCGNGPSSTAGDEVTCPGRTEYGQEGCKYIGPKWNFAPHM